MAKFKKPKPLNKVNLNRLVEERKNPRNPAIDQRMDETLNRIKRDGNPISRLLIERNQDHLRQLATEQAERGRQIGRPPAVRVQPGRPLINPVPIHPTVQSPGRTAGMTNQVPNRPIEKIPSKINPVKVEMEKYYDKKYRKK